MKDLEKIEFEGDDLKGLPLFFRLVIYNKLYLADEEAKIMKYMPSIQTKDYCAGTPEREISKTINKVILKQYES